MRRRDFLSAAGAAILAPEFARAQSPAARPTVGFFNPQAAAPFAYLVEAFRQGLAETGSVDGQSVLVDYQWGNGDPQRAKPVMEEFARRPVAAIVALGGSVIQARTATSSIPIVFTTGVDPVAQGIVASLSRPGGNVTGVTFLTISIAAKQLELLREIVPSASVIGHLVYPPYLYTDLAVAEVEAAAKILGVTIDVQKAASEQAIDVAFAVLSERKVGAMIVGSNPYFNNRRSQVIALAARHGIPAIYDFREFATEGGLVSYGGSITEAYRQVGIYVGRILKGAKPGELPVVQSAKIELIINLKTAKALNLTFPLPLLGRADEVIE